MTAKNAWQLTHPLRPILKSGEITEPLNALCESMRETKPNPFKIVLDLNFTNDTSAVAARFNDFISTSCERDKLKAIYTEINGFTINPDLWFFDPFGFDDMQPVDDDDFGCFEYYSETHSIALTGMEALQTAYATPWSGDPNEQREAYQHDRYHRDLAAFIVISKFHRLMQTSMRELQPPVPIYADGHDHGFVARVY